MARTHQSDKDEVLAARLADGKTVAAAVLAAGLGERTAYRRRKQPAVRARIAEVRRAALDTVSGRLNQGMLSARDTLAGLLGHDNPHVQIRAALSIIQLALKVRRVADIEDRLDEAGARPGRCPEARRTSGRRRGRPNRSCPDTCPTGPPHATPRLRAVKECHPAVRRIGARWRAHIPRTGPRTGHPTGWGRRGRRGRRRTGARGPVRTCQTLSRPAIPRAAVVWGPATSCHDLPFPG